VAGSWPSSAGSSSSSPCHSPSSSASKWVQYIFFLFPSFLPGYSLQFFQHSTKQIHSSGISPHSINISISFAAETSFY
jgi:uncharacterized Zn-finger protein